MAPANGTYRVQTVADNGVRVWVNGALLIDHWQSHAAGTPDTSAPFNLSAGDQASIVVEYWQGSGTATMRLRWITPGNTSAVAIPAGNLLPNWSRGVKPRWQTLDLMNEPAVVPAVRIERTTFRLQGGCSTN